MLAVDGFFAEVLCEHVVDHRAVFVAVGLAVGFDDRVNGFVEFWTVAKTELKMTTK